MGGGVVAVGGRAVDVCLAGKGQVTALCGLPQAQLAMAHLAITVWILFELADDKAGNSRRAPGASAEVGDGVWAGLAVREMRVPARSVYVPLPDRTQAMEIGQM